MTRLCERPGCSEPAQASFGIDQANLVVWLDRYGGPLAARAGVLCERHADAMVVPIGWMLDDRREAAPRLFRPPRSEAATDGTPTTGTRRRRARRTSDDDTEQLRLDAADVTAAEVAAAGVTVVAADDAADVDDAVGDAAGDAVDGEFPIDALAEPEAADAPWMPVFDHEDDLRGLLRPQGSLLSRAFNGTPRRSD